MDVHPIKNGIIIGIDPYPYLIGRVPFKYQIMTIGGVPPQLINHGLLIRG